MDENILDAYVRSLTRAADYMNKSINPIELRALIQRFKRLNPDADPRTVDWVGVWDERLTFTEQVEAFKRNYPMYRWSEKTEVSEEAFEDARKMRLEQIVRELDDESLRELLQLIQKELGEAPVEAVKMESKIEAEDAGEDAETLKPAAGPELGPVVREPTTTLTLKVLARYPLLDEAKGFLRAFEVGPEVEGYAEEAFKRIIEAIERGERGVLPRDDPVEDLLSFALGKVLCLAVGDQWLLRRWALAEAARMERNLHVEEPLLRSTVQKKLLPFLQEVNPEEQKKVGEHYQYKLPLAEYLKLQPQTIGPQWRLVNRMVYRGYVYLEAAEVPRLVRQLAYRRLQSADVRVRVEQLPPKLQEAAKEIMEIVKAMRAKYTAPTSESPSKDESKWPPCMVALKNALLSGSEVSHFGNFAFAAFLLSLGYSVDEVVNFYSQRPDFNERIARYQVEHIAGLRGSRTKYSVPSCQTMKAHGLCIEEGRLCPRNIRNPMQYRKPETTR